MNDATGLLASVAGGVIANFISFFALSALHKPSPAIRVQQRTVTVERKRLRGPLNFEMVHEKVIKNTTFVQEKENSARLRVAISLVPTVIIFGALLWALVLK